MAFQVRSVADGEVWHTITTLQWRQRKPPDEVFCIQCGPGTTMQPVPNAGLLRCERCGCERRVLGYPVFVVTGASGAGKTPVVELLAARLPRCAVFDVDVILHVAAFGWDTWHKILRSARVTSDVTLGRSHGASLSGGPDHSAGLARSWRRPAVSEVANTGLDAKTATVRRTAQSWRPAAQARAHALVARGGVRHR